MFKVIYEIYQKKCKVFFTKVLKPRFYSEQATSKQLQTPKNNNYQALHLNFLCHFCHAAGFLKIVIHTKSIIIKDFSHA